MATIGIIGTGEIGWRMGRLLVDAGCEVVGYDIRPQACQWARDAGMRIASSIAELAAESDPVITCVTDGRALDEVVRNAGGLLDTLPAGRTLIDTTSAEPWITQQLAPELAARGVRFLDAPVSGGVPAADQAKMNFMVGGDRRLLEEWTPLLSRLGPVITHVGGIGAGHTVKAVNMLALAASMLATGEALAIGAAAGHDPGDLVARLEAGQGASYSTRVHYPRFIVPGNYASGFSFDLMRKDLSIAIALADRHDVPLQLGRTTWELYRAGVNTGLAGGDNTRIVASLLDGAGTTVRKAASDAVPVRDLEALARAANTVVAAEVLALGAAVDLPPAIVREVLTASSGDSYVFSDLLPAYLETGTFPDNASLADVREPAARAAVAGIGQGLALLLTPAAVAVHAASERDHGPDARADHVVDWVAAWSGRARGGPSALAVEA